MARKTNEFWIFYLRWRFRTVLATLVILWIRFRLAPEPLCLFVGIYTRPKWNRTTERHCVGPQTGLPNCCPDRGFYFYSWNGEFLRLRNIAGRTRMFSCAPRGTGSWLGTEVSQTDAHASQILKKEVSWVWKRILTRQKTTAVNRRCTRPDLPFAKLSSSPEALWRLFSTLKSSQVAVTCPVTPKWLLNSDPSHREY